MRRFAPASNTEARDYLVDGRGRFVLYAHLQVVGLPASIRTIVGLRTFASIGRQIASVPPGGRMYRFLTALQRGFHDWIGWKRLGIAASLLIIVLATSTLIRMLKGVDVNIVLLALRDISPLQIALAALCCACAFFTLTFYDLFALRTIGRKHVPYRIAALSSFTSYTVGHNVGATVFTGGAIRFRIYSEWGLTAIDVAKICFISGLTFWLGNLFVLGLGLIWHPDAATPMLAEFVPPQLNRAIGFACIAGIASYLVWLSLGQGRRELGQNGWKVVLPSTQLTLLQIAIGVVDLGFCALAMYILMPSEPYIDFISLAVVFILSTLLGFASHAPGSLGVFDAAMLVALPQFGKEHLIAALLVFRLLYFVIPFMISITILASRELWFNVILPWRNRRKMNSVETVAAPGE